MQMIYITDHYTVTHIKYIIRFKPPSQRNKCRRIQNKTSVTNQKKCKLLGNLLDTEKDILRGQSLAPCSMNISKPMLKHIIFSQKLSVSIKTRFCSCFVASVI